MKNQKYDYDLVVLGGGSAGIVSGVTAGALGLKVLLIEKNKMGGECLNTGCVPSKALIHTARVASLIQRAGEFGLPSYELDRAGAAGVLDYVRNAIGVVRDADATEQLLRDNGVTIRLGTAHFTGVDSLQLEGDTIRAPHFILATGSSPVRPFIPGWEESGGLTNEEIFSLAEIPRRLVVLGGGPIGVEMAQAFHRLGSQVILVEIMDRLLPRDDLELARELERLLRDEGLEIRLETRLERVETEGGSKRLTLKGPGGEETLDTDLLLAAVGRKANVEGLNLAAAGVQVEKRGVWVDQFLHTTGPHVWACGDVTGTYQFSHIAEFEAKLVVQNLFLPVRQKVDYRVDPWTTFTDPEVSHVGLTEEAARKAGIPYEVHRQPFTQDDRALVEQEGKGFVKIISTGWSGKILGAHILGPRSGELIQEFVIAMRHNLNIRDIADAIHVYPTLSIASQRAAQRWYEARSKEPSVQKLLRLYRQVRPALPTILAGSTGVLAAAAGLAAWRKVRK